MDLCSKIYHHQFERKNNVAWSLDNFSNLEETQQASDAWYLQEKIVKFDKVEEFGIEGPGLWENIGVLQEETQVATPHDTSESLGQKGHGEEPLTTAPR